MVAASALSYLPTTLSHVHVTAQASIVDGAIITTGGGFSAVAVQPDWQKDAVDG